MDSFYTSSIAVCGAMVACRGSPASQLDLRAALARMTQSTARLFYTALHSLGSVLQDDITIRNIENNFNNLNMKLAKVFL